MSARQKESRNPRNFLAAHSLIRGCYNLTCGLIRLSYSCALDHYRCLTVVMMLLICLPKWNSVRGYWFRKACPVVTLHLPLGNVMHGRFNITVQCMSLLSSMATMTQPTRDCRGMIIICREIYESSRDTKAEQQTPLATK